MDMEAKEIALSLFKVGAIRLDGPYTLKSGVNSPIYLDLRVIVSHPKLLQQIADAMWTRLLECKHAHIDVVCGVPYTALPIATAMSLKHGVPMVMRRKEVKEYGTKKQIEGEVKQGDQCLVIEDLVTSGLSVFETIESLREVGLRVTDVVVLVDREQGGRQNIEHRDIRLHSVTTISQVMHVLLEESLIESTTFKNVLDFVAQNQIPLVESHGKFQVKQPQTNHSLASVSRMSYGERASFASNAIAKKMFEIMELKKTNLCCSADVTTTDALLDLASAVGEHICLLKTHIDILDDFTLESSKKLQKIAERYNFLIFEDRKFADIGSTVSNQFAGGVYRMLEWAHITNAHGVSGPGIIEGLKQAADERSLTDSRGLLMLAEMSSKGNLATNAYTDAIVKMADLHPDFVIGFISMKRLSNRPELIHMTPGVSLGDSGDALGQQYVTPEIVIAEKGNDVIIVGRGIYKANDPKKAAHIYQMEGWNAYCKRQKA